MNQTTMQEPKSSKTMTEELAAVLEKVPESRLSEVVHTLTGFIEGYIVAEKTAQRVPA